VYGDMGVREKRYVEYLRSHDANAVFVRNTLCTVTQREYEGGQHLRAGRSAISGAAEASKL
jgi:hypothetical protein